MGVHSLPTILQKHELTDIQYDAIRQTPFFAKVLENETKAWEGVLNTETRTKLKAAAIFEDLMPTLYKRSKSGEEAVKDVIETAKLMAKVAGLEQAPQKASESGGGEKFSITINLGESPKVTVVPVETIPVPANSEGTGSSPSLELGPERAGS